MVACLTRIRWGYTGVVNDDAEEIEATWLAEAERRREELRDG
jgi:hypothetical protein